MAKINLNLIFSMVSDLNELQEIGHQMTKLVGNCEIVSWRYPNKLIKDVKIDNNELFGSFEKYVLLLELIIDRLYLIMTLSINVMDSLPNLSKTFKLPKNISRANEISLGTLTSFFWKRLETLLNSEVSPSKTNSAASINSQDINSSKTEITSFVTCESCPLATKMIKELIQKIEHCMKQIVLSSIITEQRASVEKNIFKLSQFGAMQQWCNAILLDVQSLTEFITKKLSEIATLKNEIGQTSKLNENLEKKLGKIKSQHSDLEKQCIQDETKIRLLNQTNNKLEIKISQISNTLKLSEETLQLKTEKIHELENTLNQTLSDNETATTRLKTEYTKQINTAIAEKNHWTEMLEKSKQNVDELEIKLNLEREKQIEFQTKLQKDFTTEKEKIEVEKVKVVKENKVMFEKVQQLEKQMEEYRGKIQGLEEEKTNLEGDLKLCKDQEILLLQYPDLNGPIEQKRKKDPLQDMEQQLEANEIRIKLLQEQNCSLQRTVDKMKALQNKK